MPRRYYLLVTAAALAGTLLRLWQLTAVPPGLHYDLAATALLGEQVAFAGYRPLFITAFTGHEVLFYYWLAAWFNLIGSSVFALRLAAALLGALTIPATFFAVREVLHGDEHAHPTAAFAAVLLAVAFFHLVFSRFGFRVIVMPLVQALALGFLFRGLRRQARGAGGRAWAWRSGYWDLALGGAFTGLAAYTYLSARLFPFPLAVFWLALLLFTRRAHAPLRRWTAGFLTFGLAALAAFAPLGLYFLQHPEDFLNRAAQVVARPGEAELLWRGFVGAAEMLFVRGEPYDRFNLPGRPLFPLPWALFFVVGLLGTLRGAFRPGQSPGRRAVEWLLLAWLPFMLLPTALSVNEVFPSNVRAFGLTPLVFVFPARGLLAAYRWLQRQSPGPLLPTAYPVTVLTLVALALGAAATYHDYFNTWAGLRSQRLNNDADLTGVADYLNQQDLAAATPYVSAIHYRHPTLAYLARDFDAVRWLTGGYSLVVPADRAALIFDTASAPLPEAWVAGWGPWLVHEQPGPDNRPEFRAYRFEAGQTPPLPEFAPLNENFGNAVFLTGFRAEVAEADLWVDLRWRVENPVEMGDLLPYARLYDAAGRVWAQSGNFTYPAEQWRPGDLLITRQRLPLAAGLPAGDYLVKAGLYSEGAQAGLPHLTAQAGFGGERAVAGTVRLDGGPPATAAEFQAANAMTPLEADGGLEPGLQLLGYAGRTAARRPNERFEVTLFWYAAAPVTTPLTITLGGQTLSAGPLTVNGPLIDRRTLRVPLEAPAGPSPLRVQVGARGIVDVAELEVAPVERLSAPPSLGAPLSARFGPDLALVDFALAPGTRTQVTLAFQQVGAAPLDADYTIFVHVRDGQGQMVAQVDTVPGSGTYPTSLWAPGEAVVETYTFDLAPGNYRLVTGLYEAETGARLPVMVGEQPAGDELSLTEFKVP